MASTNYDYLHLLSEKRPPLSQTGTHRLPCVHVVAGIRRRQRHRTLRMQLPVPNLIAYVPGPQIYIRE